MLASQWLTAYAGLQGANWERAYFVRQNDDCYMITGPKNANKVGKAQAGPAYLFAADDNQEDAPDSSAMNELLPNTDDEEGEEDEVDTTDEVRHFKPLHATSRRFASLHHTSNHCSPLYPLPFRSSVLTSTR